MASKQNQSVKLCSILLLLVVSCCNCYQYEDDVTQCFNALNGFLDKYEQQIDHDFSAREFYTDLQPILIGDNLGLGQTCLSTNLTFKGFSADEMVNEVRGLVRHQIQIDSNNRDQTLVDIYNKLVHLQNEIYDIRKHFRLKGMSRNKRIRRRLNLVRIIRKKIRLANENEEFIRI